MTKRQRQKDEQTYGQTDIKTKRCKTKRHEDEQTIIQRDMKTKRHKDKGT
jgi:hypothetical protein